MPQAGPTALRPAGLVLMPLLSASQASHATSDLRLRLVLLATMAMWGANLSVVKWLLQTLEPMAASALRMGVASLAIGALVLVTRPTWPRLSRQQKGGLVLCAVVMLYLNQICLSYGMQRTGAANAALIMALNPLVSALMAAMLLGERLSLARAGGVALGFAGVSAVVLTRPGAAFGQASLGDLLVFGAVLTWVGGGVLVQRLARQVNTQVISCWNTWLGSLMLLTHVVLDPGTHLPVLGSLGTGVWVALVASGVLATAVGSLVWNHGLQRFGVARTALYAYWVPIFGVLFAVAWLGEPLRVWHGVGLAAVLLGTWLGSRR